MHQKIKFFLKIFFGLIASIVLVVFVLVTFFTEDIERKVISMINEKLESPLLLEDVDFTIYDNFPTAAVRIKNLFIKESKGFQDDTLLYAKKAYVEISLKDIWDKKYTLEKIIIENGKINLKYDSTKNNFQIFKKTRDQKNQLDLKDISIINTDLSIHKENNLNLKWKIESSKINMGHNKFNINLIGTSNRLHVDSTNYLNEKKINLKSTVQISKNYFKFSETKIKIDNTSCSINGEIKNGNYKTYIDLKKQGIKDIFELLPLKNQKEFSFFNADGNISINGSVILDLDSSNVPSINFKYLISNGSFEIKSNKFKLSEIFTEGNINNGKENSFESTEITAVNLKAKIKNGYIDGSFSLNNLNKNYFSSNFKSSWDLNYLNRQFKKSNFKSITGKLIAKTNYNGIIPKHNTIKKMLLHSQHNSDIELKDVEFKYLNSPLKFTINNANCKVSDKVVNVYSSSFTISESDFKYEGKINDLLSYLFDEAKSITTFGSIQSNYSNLNELMTISDLSKNKESSEKIMPNWLDSKTNIKIKNISYDNFLASNVIGNLIYKDNLLSSSNLNAECLDGYLSGGFSLNEYKEGHLKLNSDLNLKNINIRNSFTSFNNFGQDFIQEQHIKGVGSAELSIESYWKPNYILDKKKLSVSSSLSIEKGELIDFKPLENLSSYISLNELKHIKFSKLENNINVMNELIIIPTMEVKSSALSILLSGTHSFNQEIDYEITLLLSEILSKDFRKENTNITEFGEEKKDGKSYNTVYFKMNGTTENPKITLDKIRFMEDIKKTVEKEKAIINNIIKADILKKEKKENKEIEEDEIEIEWEPNK